jgi:plasmid maintenance system antidote protein VapI
MRYDDGEIIYKGDPYYHPGLFLLNTMYAINMLPEDLAKKTGYDVEFINKLLNSKIDFDKKIVEKLSPILDYPVDFFLGIQERYDQIKAELRANPDLEFPEDINSFKKFFIQFGRKIHSFVA